MGSTPRGIGASRGAAVLGLSEWATTLEVWQQIMEERFPARPSRIAGGSITMQETRPDADGYTGYNAAHGYVLPEFKEGAPLRWGLAFEDAVVSLAEEATGAAIVDRETLFGISLSHERKRVTYPDSIDMDCLPITCHIDGRYTLGEPTLHEGKTTTAMSFREKWGEPGTDRIPRTYQIQVQHQMLCTGASEAIVSVLVFPETPDAWEKMGWIVEKGRTWDTSNNWYLRKVDKYADGSEKTLDLKRVEKWAETFADIGNFHQYRIPANPRLQELMLEHYREWWNKYVLGETPPMARSYEDIKRLTPSPRGTIIADAELARWIAEHRQIGQESAESARSRDRLKVKMIEHAATLAKVQDEESADKWVIRSSDGKKLASFDGHVFR